MLTKKVKSRILYILLIFIITTIAVIFILKSLNQNILYFSTPTEIKNQEDVSLGKAMRVGGMVKKNSITINKDNEVRVAITKMIKYNISGLPVLNNSRLVGMITKSDIVNTLAN